MMLIILYIKNKILVLMLNVQIFNLLTHLLQIHILKTGFII